MNEDEIKFSELLQDFHEKRPESEISLAVASRLKGLTNAGPDISICKLMETSIAEVAFINGAEEIEDVQFKFGYVDPPHNSKMGFHMNVLISKYGEKTLARLLVFLKRRFSELSSQVNRYKKQYALAEEEITKLASGDAIFVTCEACKGIGKSEDDNEEMTECWVCNGRGKTIKMQ